MTETLQLMYVIARRDVFSLSVWNCWWFGW